MKHTLVTLTYSIACLLFAQTALADSATASKLGDINERLKHVFGDAKTAVSDYDDQLKSVIVDDKHFFFVTHDGKYLFGGPVLDAHSGTDLIELRKAEYRKAVLGAQPQGFFVSYPSVGAVKHTLTVFTDIDCGYCRKLHATMNDLNRRGISVNYVMLPRAGKNSVSYAKSLDALCSKDPSESITRALQNQKIASASCAPTRLDRQIALAEKMSIEATPTLVLPSGELHVGMPGTAQLLTLLGEPN